MKLSTLMRRSLLILPAAMASGVVLAAAVLSTTATAAPLQHPATWKVQPTAQPSAPNSELASVSCARGSTCVAVGNVIARGGNAKPFSEVRSGRQWRITPMPASAGDFSDLKSVSCPSLRWCVAVGISARANQTFGLAEIWNGARWTLSKVRQPAGQTHGGLLAVSCTAPDSCVAAGGTARRNGVVKVLTEWWNGTSWRILATPQPPSSKAYSAFNAISCTSSRACMAVGDSETAPGTDPLAERWDGKTWHIQRLPHRKGFTSADLTGVACTSPTACTAVGTSSGPDKFKTLALRWNGTRWGFQSIPTPSGSAPGEVVHAISCPSAASCTAVGTAFSGNRHVVFAETWNGRRWTLQPIPRPARASGPALTGVSCTQAACTAVGNFQGASANVRTWAAVRSR